VLCCSNSIWWHISFGRGTLGRRTLCRVLSHISQSAFPCSPIFSGIACPAAIFPIYCHLGFAYPNHSLLGGCRLSEPLLLRAALES